MTDKSITITPQKTHSTRIVNMQGVLESLAGRSNKSVVSNSEYRYWGRRSFSAVMADEDDGWEKEILTIEGWRILDLELPRVIIVLPPGH
jgi:hypothetical protein